VYRGNIFVNEDRNPPLYRVIEHGHLLQGLQELLGWWGVVLSEGSGHAGQKVQQAIGVQLNAVSEESQVTDVLNKVTTGQADAGLVYVTDAQSAGTRSLRSHFPNPPEPVNPYPIAVLKQAKNPHIGPHIRRLVTGEAGQKVLSAAGFAKPESGHQRGVGLGCLAGHDGREGGGRAIRCQPSHAARLKQVRLTRDLRRILVWRAFPRAGQVRPVVSASRRLQHSERHGRLAAGEAPPFQRIR